MERISFFLAQIDVKDSLVADLHKTDSSRGGLTPLFVAFGIVTFLILFWAIFIRKKPDETSRRYSYPSRDSKGNDAGILDTLARSLFMQGKKERAIELENQALKLAETDQQEMLQKTLDSYKKGVLPKAK